MKATAIGLYVCCLSMLLGTGCPSGNPEQPATRPAQESVADSTTNQSVEFLDGNYEVRFADPRLRPSTRPGENVEPAAKPSGLTDYELSGPFTHGNLTVFLVHAEPTKLPEEYMTLEEALKAKTIVIHETGSVNQLAVQNKDPNVSVFIHSGDIVKGGKQDRVLAFDLIVPPNSGKVAIASFCVESGRWRARGTEQVSYFSTVSKMATGRSLKLAAKHSRSQGVVWQEVSVAQRKYSFQSGLDLRATTSPSSLQLTLESKELEKRVALYTKTLADAPTGKKNVVGMVFAVNGEINSADIYASDKLFQKLWPRLLEAAATEAFGEVAKDKTFEGVKAGDVKKWLAGLQDGKISARNLGKGVQLVNQETARDVLFDTLRISDDMGVPVLLHRNIIRKPTGSAPVMPGIPAPDTRPSQ